MIRYWGSIRSHARGDAGASLAIVMVFVICTGLVVTALAGYAQTALVSADATRSRHVLASDASGALDAAITTVRHSDYANESPTVPCPANGMVVPGDQGPVTVVCRPEPGSGVSAGAVPITALNRPGSAVLTLGRWPVNSPEIGFNKTSEEPLKIKGRVFVNSNIDIAGSACTSAADNACSKIDVLGSQAFARNGCPPNKVYSQPAPNCSVTGDPPESKDPATLKDSDILPGSIPGHPGGAAIAAGYRQPPTDLSQLVHRVVPGCVKPVTQMLPGYYDDAKALSGLTTTCDAVVHFTPGTYYFDFRTEEVGDLGNAHRPFTANPGDKNVWTIANNSSSAYVIGGTPKDWTAAGQPSKFPGACVSPLTSTANNQGVQFIFGGTSRMRVEKGQVELCGQYATDKPSLVIYGATENSPQAGTSSGVLTTSGNFTPSSPNNALFTTPASAYVIDGASATASLSRSGSAESRTASVRLTGTSLGTTMPAGSILRSASLRIAHHETGTVSGDKITLKVTPNPLRSSAVPVWTPTVDTANSTTPVSPPASSLTGNDLGKLAEEIWRHGLTDIAIDYQLSVGNAGSGTVQAALDGVQLDLVWDPPSVRNQSTLVASDNCIVKIGVGKCALVTTTGNDVFFYVQGTTYAPQSWFDITLNAVTGQVFRSGIIARALTMKITPSTTFSGPVIEVPDDRGSGVTVDLELAAYVCPPSVTCASPPPSAGWRRVGRSTVELKSAYPIPTNGSRAVKVKTWNVLG